MNDFIKFREAIKPYIDGWKSVEIRSVCFSAHERWINLGTRIILSEKTKEIISINSLPEFPRFKTFYEVHDISKLDGLLTQLEKGSITVNSKDIFFKFRIENDGFKVDVPVFNFYRNYRYERNFSYEFSFPSITLRAGESLHQPTI